MILGAIPAGPPGPGRLNRAGQVPGERPDNCSAWPSRMGAGRGANYPTP